MDRLRRRASAETQGHALFVRDDPALRRPGLHQGSRACCPRARPQGHFHSFQPQGPLSGRRRGAPILGTGAGPRRAGNDPSAASRLRRGTDERLSSRVQYWTGRPFDLCLALGRLIVRGILEDFPRVTIVASHGGGGICETISRMDYAYELQEEAFFLGSYAPIKIKHAPSHYLKKMHLDTVTYNPPAVKMVLEWMGPERVLYGSDAPPLTSLKPRAIKLIKDLDIPEAQRDAIFFANAARLLKLPIARAADAA